MENYKLSTKASQDIVGIYKYGIKIFGASQAKNYLNAVEETLDELAKRKELARDASMFAKDLKYYRYQSHVIFYVFNNYNTIFVIRVLGKRMDFIQHL